METSASVWRKTGECVSRSRSTARGRATSGCSTIVTAAGIREHAIAWRAMDAPRRNVELKAIDRDPDATLARALAAGARDQGVLVQRDTYFGAPRGRLKLREEQPGDSHLIAYDRADAAAARTSAYRTGPVAGPAQLRAALRAGRVARRARGGAGRDAGCRQAPPAPAVGERPDPSGRGRGAGALRR